MVDIYQFLQEHQIQYKRFDHLPVFTCEQARSALPRFPGAETKNLFLKDKKGRHHFLVVVGYDKAVDLKRLGDLLEVKSLSFASPDRLRRYLGLEPGSVTVLGVAQDTEAKVEVIVDKDLSMEVAWGCHPLVNTSTLLISRDEIMRFLEITGHMPRIFELPVLTPS